MRYWAHYVILSSIYFICQKSSYRLLLFFFSVLRTLLSLKLWNKKWESQYFCSVKRKGAFISLSSSCASALMTLKSCAARMRNVLLRNHQLIIQHTHRWWGFCDLPQKLPVTSRRVTGNFWGGCTKTSSSMCVSQPTAIKFLCKTKPNWREDV